MEVRRIIYNVALAAGVATALVSGCGGGGGGGDTGTLPPSAPVSGVAGIAQDGPIVNAVVSVYEFGAGSKGTLIAAGMTDYQGRYTLAINAPTQPILIEITGGSYVEEASSLSVSLTPSQSLRAVSLYTLGSAVNAQVTFYTQLAAGLAQYYATHGQSAASAVINANNEMSALVGFSILATRPLVVNDIANASVALTPSLQYGFFTGALSQWTLEASRINNTPTHSIHNSIAFAQRAFDDIAWDGMLDGVGSSGILSIGTLPLNADVYRHGLARSILTLVQSPNNQTALKTNALVPSVKAFNDSVSPIFGGHARIALDNEGSQVTGMVPAAGSALRGPIAVSADVADIVGVTGVALLIDGVAQGNALSLSRPTWPVNTASFADGTHSLTVASTNLLGHVSTTSQLVIFDNTAPVIDPPGIYGVIDIPGYPSLCTLSGTVSDAASSVVNMTLSGAPVSLSGTQWSGSFRVTVTPMTVMVNAFDAAGNAAQRSFTVMVNIHHPTCYF